MRALLVIPAMLVLGACAQEEVEALGFKNDEFIGYDNGEVFLANGVCYVKDESREPRTRINRIAPENCGIY